MGTAQDAYIELIKRFLLRPLRSARDLDQARKVADVLAVKKSLNRAERGYLDVLAGLIERYKDEHHGIDPLPDREILQFLIEQSGKSQLHVARETGIANSTISAVLRGKRELTRRQMENFSAYFHVGSGVFLASNVAAVS